jgi:iron complex transport system permease protein
MTTLVYFIGLLVMVVIAFVLQLLYGSVQIPFSFFIELFSGATTQNEVWKNIVLDSRLPGAIAALIAGAGLSVSGLQMQTMFRNPVAGPYVLGISAGASLGVAVLILASTYLGFHHAAMLSSWSVVLAAGVGAVLIFLLNFLISYRINNVIALLIVGLMLGGSISAFIEILQTFSSNESLKRYVLWTFGSFRYVNHEQVVYLTIITTFGLIFAFLLAKSLNLLLMGDAYATTSGLNVQSAKIGIVFSTSIMAGTITAFCGPIGFVGLAVPHIARMMFKSANHLLLIPACALLGAVVCGLCNVVSTLPGSDVALPINAITALLGAPVVIWIVLRQKQLS